MRHSRVVPGVGSCAASVACESLVVREREVVVKALELVVVGNIAQVHESKSQDSYVARSSVFCQTFTFCVGYSVELSSSLRSLLS